MGLRLLCGLAANPALPSGLVDRLIALNGSVDDPHDELLYDLSERTDLSPAQVRAIAAADEFAAGRMGRAGLLDPADVDPLARPSVALAMLDEGFGPPEWARALATHPERQVRRDLASRPGLPLDVQETLAADPDVEVVAELGIWTTEPQLAARLATHPHAEVRMTTALNEAVPGSVLAALITGEELAPALACLVCDQEEIPFTHDPYCRRPDCGLFANATCTGVHETAVHNTLERAARNPSTPPATAATLAGHPSMLIRRALAERSDLPQETYALLAADPMPGVRRDVAANSALGAPLIRELAAGREVELLRALALQPLVPLDVLADLARRARLRPDPLPRIESATATELAELAASPHPAVRKLAARSRALPPALLDALADDPDAVVANAVAPHPGLSEDRLRAMVARHGVQVHAQVAANPEAPSGLLEELARHDPPALRAWRAIAVHPNATEAALLPCLADHKAGPNAARHPALSGPALVGLLTHASPAVAEAAAANPSLPRPAMEELIARGPRRRSGVGAEQALSGVRGRGATAGPRAGARRARRS
ncbi:MULTISPECIES: DUF2336 domain-containing protein [unclassified Streptomyces]|uniref:DUF2336 domain-containing protein n=1 Tax=unclassified Streptomyces TaxID=2593676 RepID=UPI001EF828AA|nr:MULTISPECIES: DUF2336 domain-containing protein [unclassified Streptomyces]